MYGIFVILIKQLHYPIRLQFDRVPDWITHFINKDKIINDNLVKIHPILESLGLSTLDTRSNNPHFTNIITF